MKVNNVQKIVIVLGIVLVMGICLYPTKYYDYKGRIVASDRYSNNPLKADRIKQYGYPLVDQRRYLMVTTVVLACGALVILFSETDIAKIKFYFLRCQLFFLNRRIRQLTKDFSDRADEILQESDASKNVDHFQIGIDYLKEKNRPKAIEQVFALRASGKNQEADQLGALIGKSANKAVLKLVIGFAVLVIIYFVLWFLSK